MTEPRISIVEGAAVNAALTGLHATLEVAYTAAGNLIQAVADAVKAAYGHPAIGVCFRTDDLRTPDGAVLIAADGTTTPLREVDDSLCDLLEQAFATLFTCGAPEVEVVYGPDRCYWQYTVRAAA